VAGAACALHPLHVPDALVAATAGALADAACGGAAGGRQALAAALLTEGLAGPLGPRALPHLGPLPALTQRCGPGRAGPRCGPLLACTCRSLSRRVLRRSASRPGVRPGTCLLGLPVRALFQSYKCIRRMAGEKPAGQGRLVCRPPRHSFAPS